MGIYLKQGYCTYAMCVSQTPCTWEQSQAAFFFSIYHPQQCQLRDFWPGWHGNRKQSKSWIGTTTHQNFMIILIDAHLQRENLLTFWCVVYYDEDQLLCTTMKVKDQLLRFTMKMKDQLLWITMKFYQGRSKYCPEWASLLALESSRGPKWVKDPGNGLKSIRGTFFRRR